ncbi:hypothetical protein PBI_MRMAGOO_45 [Mycobacterium phage MrMagoo]|uniref:Uncharacterized protein n=1 Tax=Mycobacterium phage MrMagoo TaxID=1927020 RepID=A0A1L6BYH8_9CAUD|nr:hypothetical protein J4U04_gp045 [Mycobacterium phage MrMagoo]APQ42150.1 hypothetical protein PBI_MRMAGOO_45 [Mycobacterium phage MrMagoo]ARM70225.1 hypothetical protein SEA_GARDENSALSA_45 [Mycobacterium phage GardenSalsa]
MSYLTDATIEDARAAGPFWLCEDLQRKCPASDDGLCDGGYAVDGDDWLRCLAEGLSDPL